MPIDVVTTYLEMTSPAELLAGRLPPAPIEMVKVESATSALLLRSIYTRIAQPWGWRNVEWSNEQWDEWLGRRERQRWIFRVGAQAVGMVEAEVQPGEQVEIVVFGLIPEFVGKGFGGHALTLATEWAWHVEHDARRATRRVWLHTSSRDHPHALQNYLSRGFRRFTNPNESS